MILTRFGMLGFAKTYLPQRFIEEQNAVYSENSPVALSLNPTYFLIQVIQLSVFGVVLFAGIILYICYVLRKNAEKFAACRSLSQQIIKKDVQSNNFLKLNDTAY